jgi:hypothetical protein
MRGFFNHKGKDLHGDCTGKGREIGRRRVRKEASLVVRAQVGNRQH